MGAERRSGRGERGFTIFELIVGLAIIVMMASVVAPVLVGALDQARVKQGEESLLNIATAVDAFAKDVKEHPASLGQLWQPIEPSHSNLCGNRYKSGTGKGGTDTWLGPYLVRDIPASGLPIGLGVVQNQFAPEGSGNKPRALVMSVTKVSEEDALALNERIDGDGGDRNGGTIRWRDAAVEGTVVLEYWIPYPRC